MMDDQQSSGERRQDQAEQETVAGRKLPQKLAAIGWGAFLVWIGLILLFKVGSGIGALGIGFIILGIQFARRFYGLKFESFWMVAGTILVIAGLWELFEARLPLVPIMLILVGVAVVLSALKGKPLLKR